MSLQTDLKQLFPGIDSADFEETSPRTRRYNCIAWAAGDTGRKWWPFAGPPLGHWPPGVTRTDTVGAFFDAFATLGFETCVDASIEVGFEKVAIYVGTDGRVKHMARQLPSGQWTSKLGDLEDIRHQTLEMVESNHYGTAQAFMKRIR